MRDGLANRRDDWQGSQYGLFDGADIAIGVGLSRGKRYSVCQNVPLSGSVLEWWHPVRWTSSQKRGLRTRSCHPNRNVCAYQIHEHRFMTPESRTSCCEKVKSDFSLSPPSTPEYSWNALLKLVYGSFTLHSQANRRDRGTDPNIVHLVMFQVKPANGPT